MEHGYGVHFAGPRNSGRNCNPIVQLMIWSSEKRRRQVTSDILESQAPFSLTFRFQIHSEQPATCQKLFKSIENGCLSRGCLCNQCNDFP
jgi:hypothetical protein